MLKRKQKCIEWLGKASLLTIIFSLNVEYISSFESNENLLHIKDCKEVSDSRFISLCHLVCVKCQCIHLPQKSTTRGTLKVNFIQYWLILTKSCRTYEYICWKFRNAVGNVVLKLLQPIRPTHTESRIVHDRCRKVEKRMFSLNSNLRSSADI